MYNFYLGDKFKRYRKVHTKADLEHDHTHCDDRYGCEKEENEEESERDQQVQAGGQWGKGRRRHRL